MSPSFSIFLQEALMTTDAATAGAMTGLRVIDLTRGDRQTRTWRRCTLRAQQGPYRQPRGAARRTRRGVRTARCGTAVRPPARSRLARRAGAVDRPGPDQRPRCPSRRRDRKGLVPGRGLADPPFPEQTECAARAAEIQPARLRATVRIRIFRG